MLLLSALVYGVFFVAVVQSIRDEKANMRLSKTDPNSYSRPEDVIITHADLDWTANFEKQIIQGSALLKFKVIANVITSIFLDVSDIKIDAVTIKAKAGDIPVNFFVSDLVKDIGSKLTIDLPSPTSGLVDILIEYETSKTASALQWLTPEQTLGKQQPYLFSQCQAIHARSILPCQDTPAVKFTYNATLRHPIELVGLMSAIIKNTEPGVTRFEQSVPIPSYLIAIAVGKLVSRSLGPISSVWAEEQIIEDAAYEFAETGSMIKAAESICGPYVWKQYDLLVMPPSFPYGGMENPCLTFVTPTLIAKDRSLATVVAHEIAHSWTGNLVTNKNFEHFWLNEGFTVFTEGKIVGLLKGADYRDFHAIHALSELSFCIKSQLSDHPELTKLVVDLSNIGPDDAFSSVPYVKGMTFLRYIEASLGGPDIFEPFFKFYLNKYKYQSILTNDFKKTLYDYFKENEDHLRVLEQIDWDLWLDGEGMPPIIPKYDRTLADRALEHTKLWAGHPISEIKISPVLSKILSSVLVIEFLDKLLEYQEIVDLNADKVELLSQTYGVEKTENAEIRFRYLLLCIKARLMPKMEEILKFANSNFRMKYVRPLYRELNKWPEAREQAIENFKSIRNQMMKVCATSIAKDLGLK